MNQQLVQDNGEVTDEMLMLSYAQGEDRAFETLYLKHKGSLYRYFIRQLSDSQLAEDLYQETWGRVIRSASQYQVSAKFTTWLYRIAHNLLVDHIRAVKPVETYGDIDALQHEEALAEIDCEVQSLDDQAINWQKSLIFKVCLSLLPQVQKEALLLNLETGLTAQAISEIVDASYEATKSRLRYAHAGVKECVTQRWQGESHDG